MDSLKSSTKIPIKNIYYMLCYAWNRLEEKDAVNVSRADEKDLHHLLSRILVNRLRILIKRGFYKEYTSIEEETPSIRGRIDFQQSLNELSFKKARMYCQYDEMTHDILHNQIIKSTLYELLKTSQVDERLKGELQQIYHYFRDIRLIKLNTKVFNDAKIHRSNSHYGFLIDICRFLHESLLMNENETGEKFINFEQDATAMAYLYEDFVRNFYKEELPESKVYRENIYWNAEGEDLSYLPRMETDISLEWNDRKVIMDTKYYQNATSSKLKNGNEKLISTNLYQIHAYLSNFKNREMKDLTGILLYPTVDRDLDLFYNILGFKIKVCTVDFNQEWRNIHERLLSIVDIG
ncbi:5-methylcytosine-specific restriction endonuclease system specificity protein McrC [Virgibacillus litoralis]|uniref:5-methylcytosine-specific restriction enzyme subunit McrC n=1 Tax=Virgibacillus litoralis TaxID=578221 RepID=A0ABS4H894_9BACI|nr:5-methylcytosine-specific restriction endonuclease system specificity protein McrC [Virgibacillus litoralis]MBP1947126.1 5-methylcytosine-specific restriction enzyme subunit McrC [Virgibacillus litoralis]